MNFSIDVFNKGYILPEECVEWCVAQHYSNDYAGMVFVLAAFFLSMLLLLFNLFGAEMIKKSSNPLKTHKFVNVCMNSLILLVFLFLLCFLYYWKMML